MGADPITNVAISGLTQIQQLGLAGIFLSFIFILGIWIVSGLKDVIKDVKLELANCRDSHSKTEAARISDMKETREVIERNSSAFKDMQLSNATSLQAVQLTLARIELKVGNDR